MTVDFKLYNSSANCLANNGTGLVGSQPGAPADCQRSSGTASTNTGVAVSVSGTFFWHVSSTGNATNAAFPAGANCTESVVVTFAGS